jgi:hypothetical protein
VFTNSHNVLNRWKKYLCLVLNLHDVKNGSIAEPLVPDSSSFQVEIAIEKPERYKSLSSDQSPAQLIQALRSEIPN